MGSAFLGIEVVARALMAQQQGIEVTAQNVANASSREYSRQAVDLVTISPQTVLLLGQGDTPAQLGQGVEANTIRRIRDSFLDYQIRARLQSAGEWEIKRDTRQQIEAIYSEPSDFGLSRFLDGFWASWQELATKPEDLAIRANLIERAQNLTVTLKRLYQQLETVGSELEHQAQLQVEKVNQLTQQIAALNGQILQGGTVNVLEDRRDQLLDELSRLVKISYTIGEEGLYHIFLGGRFLVERTQAAELQVDLSGGILDIQWAEDSSSIAILGGELKGLLDGHNSILVQEMADLQAMTGQFIAEVNALHVTGYDLNGVAGLDFFTGSGANDIAVNATLGADPSRIAAAGEPQLSGDNTVALLVAQLAHSLTQVGSASEVQSGLSLPLSGATVIRVAAPTAVPDVTYNLSSPGAGQLTLSAIIGGNPVEQTVVVADMEAGGFQTLDFSEVGVQITLAAGASSATATDLIADLTDPARDSVEVESRTTVGGVYQQIVARLGVETQRADTMFTNEELLVQHLDQRKEAVSGVSLDEETINLIRYQRAYQAAARVIRAIDELLETLLYRLG